MSDIVSNVVHAGSKHLKLSIVEAALQMMKSWILEYMDKECPDAQGPDPNHHSLFYRQMLETRIYK